MQRRSVEELTKDGEEQVRRLNAPPWKTIAILAYYFIWIKAIVGVCGGAASIPAWVVPVLWLYGWPKGIWKNIGVFLGLGFFAPVVLAVVLKTWSF